MPFSWGPPVGKCRSVAAGNRSLTALKTELINRRQTFARVSVSFNKLMFRTEQGLLRLLRTKPHRKHQSVVRNSWYCTHLFNSVLSITFLKHVFSTPCCLNGHGPFKTAHLGAKVALGAEVTGTQVCFKSSHLERKVAGGEPKHV